MIRFILFSALSLATLSSNSQESQQQSTEPGGDGRNALQAVSLHVSAINSNEVALRWSAGDSNDVYYKVEKSRDGVVWTEVAVVFQGEDKPCTGNYFFKDKSRERKNSFYRVRQIDTKGHSTYSGIGTV